jgi:DNA-binding NarL/FixJ family response regulator
MTTRILIADDHDIIRAGLAAVLGRDPDLQVVGEAGNGREALDLVRSLAPDLVILDVAMPGMDGVEAARAILQERPGTRILALSMHEDQDSLLRMLRTGASGYLLKVDAAREIANAIRLVLAGRCYLSPTLIDGVVRDLVKGPTPGKEVAPPVDLTPRQLQVLHLLVEGKCMKEAAFEMGLSIKTLEKHRNQLMARLGAKNPAELIVIAVRKGIVDPFR